MESTMFVSICGLIGSGKSTLVDNLERLSHYTVYREPVESNPFLELYYQDPYRWSYTMQVNLLFTRYKQSQEAYLKSSNGDITVMDSSIYSDLAFALVQKRSHYFTYDEFNSYLNMHKVISAQTAYPDKIFWLEFSPSDTIERIKKRSRSCESSIPISYLEDLYEAYHEVFDKLKRHTDIISIDASKDAYSVYSTVNNIITESKNDSSTYCLKYN